jgi:serine/threonine protein kinase
MTQIGSGVYGAGKYGRTIDLNPRDVDDNDNLRSMLSPLADGRGAHVYIHTSDKRRIRLSPSDISRFLSATNKMGTQYIVKEFFNMNVAVFRQEILLIRMIANKLSQRQLKMCTTLGAIPFALKRGPKKSERVNIIGLEVPGTGLFCFSNRCDAPMDKYCFSGDSDVCAFVSDILSSFHAIHSSGIFHCDVKLDNLIYCATDSRFKIIDWGKSTTMVGLIDRYTQNKSKSNPNTTASPVAWLAWGLGYASSLLYASFSTMRHWDSIIVCPRISTFISHVFGSFQAAWDEKLGTLHATSLRDHKFRQKLVRQYGASFDLFDFGFILVYIACKYGDRIDAQTGDRLLDLARRLTSYGDSDFIGNAKEALDVWKKS